MKAIRIVALSVITLATLALAACSSPGAQPHPSSPPTTQRFSTSKFAHAFSIVPPTWAPRTPSTESSTFVTWESTKSDLKLRVMAPVVLFLPNSTTVAPLPIDYSSYLLGLADDGVHFSDVVHRVISGHQAVVVTGTTDDGQDGSLGCPTTGMNPSACYAFQPDLVLRLAAIDDDSHPVLVWLRDDVGAKNLDADIAAFDKTLGTLSFTG